MDKSNSKKKFIRFTPSIDIVVLKEVVAVNPYEDNTRWIKVLENVNTAVAAMRPDAHPFSERSLRDRLVGLLGNYVRDDMESLRKSGTEEEYNEREQLLQEIREQKEEAEGMKKEKKSADKRNKENEETEGQEIRRKAMEGMNKDEPTPKKAKFDVGDYLNRKLDLEERRLEAERERQAAEREERKAFMELIMQQCVNK